MAVNYPKATDVQQAVWLGTWDDSEIPVYDVPDMHTLNQLVGYVKHINAGEGTVLYRGQCKLYPEVIPSIRHEQDKYDENKERLKESVEATMRCLECLKFLGLRRPEIEGWKLYQEVVIEAVLQHYGACTYSVDFVDNHWTALWFGLNAWDATNKKYIRRIDTGMGEPDAPIQWNDSVTRCRTLPQEPTIDLISLSPEKMIELHKSAEKCEIPIEELVRRNKERLLRKEQREWKSACAKVEAYNMNIWKREGSDHLYLFLYVAETDGPYFNGLYIGKNCYTLDLRKVLPSVFLRPCSQHGWIVKGKSENYKVGQNIACVIRISVTLADEMLGYGALLSQENFFPGEQIDQGYKVLLERQKKSRLPCKFEKILPPGMITDFGPLEANV